jgi:hypothetical protein
VIDDLNKVVRGLVRIVMSMPANSVRPADQIIPAGGQGIEIATVKVISCVDVGTPSEDNVDNLDNTSTERVTGPKRAVVSIQFFRGPSQDDAGIAKYGNAAVDRATRLVQRLHLTKGQELMAGAGLGLLDASPVRNLAAVQDATWESRAQVDLTFDWIARETDTVETIESVPITLSLQGSHGEQTTTFEVTT